MNNEVINELVGLIKENKAYEVYQAGSVIEDYFDAITWSIEKEEWNKMKFAEKYGFAHAIIKAAMK